MNNAYLLEGLEASPISFQTLYLRLSHAQLHAPTHPGRFSPLEVIAHLADWEPILLSRMKRAKENPGVQVEGFDEGELAKINRYADSDIKEQLSAFSSARAQTLDFLGSLERPDFDLHFMHLELGRQTIEDLSAMMLGHDQYHLEQVTDVLAR